VPYRLLMVLSAGLLMILVVHLAGLMGAAKQA